MISTIMIHPAVALTLLILILIGQESRTATVQLRLSIRQVLLNVQLTSGINIQEVQQMYYLQTHITHKGIDILRKQGLVSKSIHLTRQYPRASGLDQPQRSQGKCERSFSFAIIDNTCLASLYYSIQKRYILFRQRYIGDGCQFYRTIQAPISTGTKTNMQQTIHRPISSFYSIELNTLERAQRPKITNIAQALNLSPPISFRYTNPLMKNPRLKNPKDSKVIPLSIPPKGYSPHANKAEAATPSVQVLSDIYIGTIICPAPEAIRNSKDKAECSKAILFVKTANDKTVNPIMMSLLR